MQPEQIIIEPCKIPKQLFLCKVCSETFIKPVTLNCGHSFCRTCIKNARHLKEREKGPEKKNKIPICPVCEKIIWRPISELSQNKTLQALIEKFNYTRDPSTIPVENREEESEFHANFEGKFRNKILLKCKKPKTFPMPSCYTEVIFSTVFIEDITEQSKQLVLIWDDPGFEFGLLGSITRIQSMDPSSKGHMYNPIIQSHFKQETFKAIFIGHYYVQIEDVGSILIDLTHRSMMVGESEKIQAELSICDCTVVHAKNYQMMDPRSFDNFFTFYDLMNNPHYMNQIASLINQAPFQTRNNSEMMMYCVLKVLKLPQKKREQLVKCWDDIKRIEMIDDWLIEKQNCVLDEIMNIKIPGKYNQGFVFFVIFLLFALNFFQQ